MRWTDKTPGNDVWKVVTKFLWCPLLINGEWRWLEKATWKEQHLNNSMGHAWFKRAWVD